jgi:hypothetical protein
MRQPVSRPELLHPRHGVHAPSGGTPPRRPGSVRRTSTVDTLRQRPDARRITLVGRSRDLATSTSSHEVLAAASSWVEVDLEPHPTVASVMTFPAVGGAEELCGCPAGPGFRRAIDELTTAPVGSGEYLLLDEIPVCTLVSFYARMRAPAALEVSNDIGDAHGANGCAGFVAGGTIMSAIDAGRRAVSTGPAAPPLLDHDDELAWHELPRGSAVHRMRRWRRTDVWCGEDGWEVESFYRDSHWTLDGYETVVHEYTVRARVDDRLTIAECSSEARVLPFVECRAAAASARRITGWALGDLRRGIRANLTGITTCTHLNDQLRGLADVETLIAGVP